MSVCTTLRLLARRLQPHPTLNRPRTARRKNGLLPRQADYGENVLERLALIGSACVLCDVYELAVVLRQ